MDDLTFRPVSVSMFTERRVSFKPALQLQIANFTPVASSLVRHIISIAFGSVS